MVHSASKKKKGGSICSQVRDIPRVDQRLDDEPAVRRFPKVRAALTALRLPIFGLGHTLREDLLDAAPPTQRIELFRVIYRAAKLEPLADRPVIFDVRTFVDRERVGGKEAVVVLRRRRWLHRKLSLEHVPHRVSQAARPRKDGAVVRRSLGRILRCAHRRTPRARVDKRPNWSRGMDPVPCRVWRADRARAVSRRGVQQHRRCLATMNVCLHECRVGRVGAGLGRHDRRSIQLVKNPTGGNNRFGHTRDFPVHGRHIDFDRGLRPCQGRRTVVGHT
jgi:hypothetical protein